MKNEKYWNMTAEGIIPTFDELRLAAPLADLVIEFRAEPTDRPGEIVWTMSPCTLEVTDKDSPVIELHSDDDWIIQKTVEDLIDFKETIKALPFEFSENWGDKGCWIAECARLKLKDKDGFDMPVRVYVAISLREED